MTKKLRALGCCATLSPSLRPRARVRGDGERAQVLCWPETKCWMFKPRQLFYQQTRMPLRQLWGKNSRQDDDSLRVPPKQYRRRRSRPTKTTRLTICPKGKEIVGAPGLTSAALEELERCPLQLAILLKVVCEACDGSSTPQRSAT